MPCRRLWQVDWVEWAPDGEWNILCPGLSLEQSAQWVDSSRPTLAVNSALRAPKPVTVWVSWDSPSDTVHGTAWRRRGAGGAIADPRYVLTSGPYMKRWHAWWSRIAGLKDPWVIAQHREDPLPEPWVDAGLDASPSWLLALRAVVLRGAARRVRFFGLDLAGEGYAFDAPDPRRRDLEDWEGRWVGERSLWRRAVELCEAIGIELVQVRA